MNPHRVDEHKKALRWVLEQIDEIEQETKKKLEEDKYRNMKCGYCGEYYQDLYGHLLRSDCRRKAFKGYPKKRGV